MVDDEGVDDAGDEQVEEHRSEGVRIIGAQEAAEAAARPDVARRRRRGEKRFGDRPDPMEPEPDLPTVRISSSGGIEPVNPGDHFGAVPVVRPADAAHPDPDEPRWGAAEESFSAVPDPGTERSFGHARVVHEPPASTDDGPADGEPPTAEPPATAPPTTGAGGGDDEGPGSWTPEPETNWSTESAAPWEETPAGTSSWDEPSPSWETSPSPWDEPSPGGWEEQPVSSWSDEPQPRSGDEPEPWSDRPDPWAASAAAEEEPWSPEPAPWAGEEAAEPGSADVAAGGFEPSEEDSFVLPHWTEPATGQVPKVVIGDDVEPEPLTSTGSQPRWRDEGDQTVEADFEDLLADAPRLGALDDGTRSEVEDDFFDAEADRDPLSAFAPDDELDLEGAPVATRTRARRDAPARRRRPSRGEEPDGGDEGASGGGDRNLPVAVGVGVALVLVGLGAFAAGGLATTLLACAVVGFSAFEFFTAVQRRGHHPATLLGLTAVVGLLLATYTDALGAYPVVLGLTMLLGLLWYLWVAPGERSAVNLGLTLLGVVWIGALGSFATLFLGLGRQMMDADGRLTSNPGIGVLIAAVVASVSHDVGAYFVGRYYGSTPLNAASPNKTLEGLVGGVLTALVVTVVVIGFFGVSPIGDELPQTFLFALLCALVAPLGDLCESFIKRDLGIKDMGAVLPGHGGVLDRFDSLLFVLPTAYFVTILFDIWS
jgi:phosphatidate cytidylyltransferase